MKSSIPVHGYQLFQVLRITKAQKRISNVNRVLNPFVRFEINFSEENEFLVLINRGKNILNIHLTSHALFDKPKV